jgi:hypothetical protein
MLRRCAWATAVPAPPRPAPHRPDPRPYLQARPVLPPRLSLRRLRRELRACLARPAIHGHFPSRFLPLSGPAVPRRQLLFPPLGAQHRTPGLTVDSRPAGNSRYGAGSGPIPALSARGRVPAWICDTHREGKAGQLSRTARPCQQVSRPGGRARWRPPRSWARPPPQPGLRGRQRARAAFAARGPDAKAARVTDVVRGRGVRGRARERHRLGQVGQRAGALEPGPRHHARRGHDRGPGRAPRPSGPRPGPAPPGREPPPGPA